MAPRPSPLPSAPLPLLATATPTALPFPSPTSAPTATPHPLSPYTIEGLRARTYPGGQIELTSLVLETDFYTYYTIRYPSDNLWITGGLHLPKGDGPFPVVVLCHGYIPPEQYFPGADTSTAANELAEQGFLCVAPAFRGWGGPDRGPNYFRTGIVIDTLNLISSLPSLPRSNHRASGLAGS